jgi:tetratricopeptide (TPR) repeat protein
MGFFILLARVIERLTTTTTTTPGVGKVTFAKSRVVVMLCLMLAPWLVMSWRHNHIWGDEVRYCKWWLAKSPDFVAVNAYIAKAYELRKEFDKARAHYSTVLGRKYKAYIAYTNMGLMDLQEEKWDSAKQNFKSALDLDPRASVTISNLGAIAFKDGNFKEALEYFERCKELDRFAILPRLNISKVYLKMDDHKRAAQTLEDALEIVPYHEIALVNLIKIYIDRNDRANVEKVARWILERSQNPNALNNVAIIFKSYGQDALSRDATAKARRFSGQ